ncbi:MAG: hypothetical protein H8E25_12055, partial [Planctomycetes bacterium]|nr:hypothetical protein [Planctomycetota bacterium]
MKNIIFTLLFLISASGLAHAAQDKQELITAFAEQGVNVDLEKSQITIQSFICQLREPLEYLLVLQPQGKDHESLLYTKDINAEALNAAMIMLGAQKGENGQMVAVEPRPSDEQIQQGVKTHTYYPPTGSGFILWVEWNIEQDDGSTEHYKYRVEDLVLNVQEERTYQRGEWV